MSKSRQREIGDAWLEKPASALLQVPSVITPETYNWLLNPRHVEAKKVTIVHVENHLYDSRLFKG
ncbi:MAG TPA: RES family NAD+ phosphorylase [Edaphobacter sp.]|nr:RES family NAD+ phosphorylase [Edaphobacter sp.]